MPWHFGWSDCVRQDEAWTRLACEGVFSTRGKPGAEEKLAQIHRELGGRDSSLRACLTVQEMAIAAVDRLGSERLRHEWLPSLLNGSLVGALAFSEEGAGSDLSAIQSRVQATDSGHYLLEGKKFWITQGLWADAMVVLAREGSGHSLWWVRANAPGVTGNP